MPPSHHEREQRRDARRNEQPRPRRKILRLPEVSERTGRSRSSIYDDIADGTFPGPIPLGRRAVGWLEEEIDDWLDARILERNDVGLRRERSLQPERRAGSRPHVERRIEARHAR